MSSPIISVYKAENYDSSATAQTTWNAGTVAADQSDMTVLSVLIWNNRASSENVSHLRECTLSIEDTGTTVTDVVENKWVKAKLGGTTTDTTIISADQQHLTYNNWLAIGGTGTSKTVLNVRPASIASNTDIQYSDLSYCTLSGDSNTGNTSTNRSNYAEVTLWMKPPPNSEPGTYNVVAKISGFYT